MSVFDVLTLIGDLERISDHCSAICASVVQAEDGVNIHAAHPSVKNSRSEYRRYYDIYTQKYLQQVTNK